jgi:hypothetical protein
LTDLQEVFSGAAGPGLHRLDRVVTAEDLAEMAAGHGWIPIVVDLVGVADKTTLLDRIAEAGQFPGFTGRNWDALQDALGDLSWLGPTDGYLLVLAGWDAFAETDPGDATVAESVLTSAGTEWTSRGTSLVTVRL